MPASTLPRTGQAFRQMRLKAGVSLRAVARNANLSAPYVSDLELGRRNFSPATARRLLNALFNAA